LRPVRLVPDNTNIQFMRGRFAGVIGSAILSTLSVVLFFYPGLNLGVDFRGGAVVELRGPQALQVDVIREAFAPLGFGDLRVQEFGSPQDVLVRFANTANLQDAQRMIASRVAEALPGVQIRRTEVVGARVSGELFRNGLLATGLALVAVLVYIWFRFEWQFGVGCVATLILDITKTVGFFAVTQIEFDLNSVAALLTLIGYSVTDKVVVYDRIRENLGKYRTMPLRPLIDLSINQTLGRTVATSLTVVLSILPLALIGRLRQLDDSANPGLRQEEHADDQAVALQEALKILGPNEEAVQTLHLAIASARRFGAWRERGKTSAVKVMHEVRAPLFELGRRLTARGELDHPQQVFMALEPELDLLATHAADIANSSAPISTTRPRNPCFCSSAACQRAIP